MIEIQMSRQDFVYDVQGLCKSFYPSAQIVIKDWERAAVISGEPEILLQIELAEDYVEVTAHREGVSKQRRAQTPKDNRRGYKNVLKKLLYELLSEMTGKQLPWGTLTGVRPTKLVMERLEIGESRADIDAYMKEHYFCSKEKITLGYEISKKELEILNAIDYKNGYSLYVGIPFCPTRCSYCSFPSYPMGEFGDLVERYLEALFQEISYVASKSWNKRLSTIYVGGGTPTTLSAKQLERLLRHIKQCCPMEHVVEFTVEAGRPDSITREKLEVMKQEGVTRISINPQTMNQETLERIGRKHTVEDVERVFAMARKVGHDNINMDLIIGLPGENSQALRQTLSRIEKLDPENLTVHSLVLKRAARLNTERVNEASCKSDQTKEEMELVGETAVMSEISAKYAAAHGYEPYYMYRQKNATGTDSDSRENIGYAKPGTECIYNILIMEEKQTILAVGAGASSKFLLPKAKKKIARVENVKSVTDYIQRIDEMIERKEHFWVKNSDTFVSFLGKG